MLDSSYSTSHHSANVHRPRLWAMHTRDSQGGDHSPQACKLHSTTAVSGKMAASFACRAQDVGCWMLPANICAT